MASVRSEPRSPSQSRRWAQGPELQVLKGSSPPSTDHAVQATVQSEAGMPRAMPSDYAQARASEQQMPRAMPSDYAASTTRRATLRRDPGAAPARCATTQAVSVGSRTSVRHSPPGDGTRRDGRDRGRSCRRDGGSRPLDGDRERPRSIVHRRKSETMARPSPHPARVRRWRSRVERCSRSQRPPSRYGVRESPARVVRRQMGRCHGPSGGFSPLPLSG